MTRGVPHPPELRAEVIAAVLAGTSIAQAALQFGLSKSLVSEWASADLSVRTVRTEKSVDLELLIRRYLDAGFRAMISQAEVFSDPDYCRRQDADKLAIAHGVLGDKLAGVAATAQALGLLGVPLEDDADQARLDAPGASAAEP
jgi:transposase-like protein